MYDHLLRVPKKVIYQPLARALLVSANVLTAVGLILGLAAAACCCFGWWSYALAFWLANRFFDGLDGEVARATNTQSDLGGYLDILADLIVYAFIPLGIAAYYNSTFTWLALALMLSSFYLNVGSWMYLSSILEKRGQGAESNQEITTVAMPKGLIEGAETVVFFTLFLLLPGCAGTLFALFAILTFLGAFLRVKWAAKTLS